MHHNSRKYNRSGLDVSQYVIVAVSAAAVFVIGLLWPALNNRPLSTAAFICVCYLAGVFICSRYREAARWAVVLFTLEFMGSAAISYTTWVHAVDSDRTVAEFTSDQAQYDTYAAWMAETGERLSAFADTDSLGNYPGIIHFYAAVYRGFGTAVINAVAINNVLVAASFLLLLEVAELLRLRKQAARYLSLFLICPEVVYFASMPCKEIASIALALGTTYAIFLAVMGKNSRWRDYILPLTLVLLLWNVRVHVVIAVGAVSFLAALLARYDVKKPAIVGLVAMLVVIGVAAAVSRTAIWSRFTNLTVGFDRDAVLQIDRRLEERGELMFSENSITQRFIPYNPIECVAYSPIRAAFYLISPFPPIPYISQPIPKAPYTTATWWPIATCFMGIVGLFTLAISFDRLLHGVRGIEPGTELHWIPAFWVLATLFLMSNSYAAIQDRYRIYADPMWILAIYIGATARTAKNSMLVNFAVVVAGACVYIVLKL